MGDGVAIFTKMGVGGWFTKNRYRGGGLPKKGGLGQFKDLEGGGLGKKEGGGVFEGGGWGGGRLIP